MREYIPKRQKSRKTKSISIEDERRNINQARIALGLEPITFGEKKCIKCNSVFLAQLKTNNFFCDGCRQSVYRGDTWEY